MLIVDVLVHSMFQTCVVRILCHSPYNTRVKITENTSAGPKLYTIHTLTCVGIVTERYMVVRRTTEVVPTSL